MLKWISSPNRVSTLYEITSLSTKEKEHEEIHLLFYMTINDLYFNTKYYVQNPLIRIFTYNIKIYTYEKEIQHRKMILRQHDNNW